MTDNLADLMPFSKLMGIQITEATKEKVSGSITVRPELCTTNNIMHGGAMMAFADTMGAIAASLNLPEGANGTTTIESKTNFLRAAARRGHPYRRNNARECGQAVVCLADQADA